MGQAEEGSGGLDNVEAMCKGKKRREKT